MKSNNYEWFEKGYVFNFDKKCLVNYKTGEEAKVRVSHYMYGEDGSVFSYEKDLDKYLRKCRIQENSWGFFKKDYYDFPIQTLKGNERI